jgi:glutamate synthase domain-containing protein 3
MTGGLVVVLGTTGRNFAAGMSGGVAYVLDEDGAFASRCNTSMVELSSVDDEDATTVRDLITAHVKRTGSPKGTRLLAAWSEARRRLVKVLPLEYKKVLAAKKAPAPQAATAQAAQKGVA